MIVYRQTMMSDYHFHSLRTTFLPMILFLYLLAIFFGLPEARTSASLVMRDKLNSFEDNFFAMTPPISSQGSGTVYLSAVKVDGA
ncbi:MAG: hypothetical protein CVT63_03645 [Candidatus Anoxymicrobium japonicum]|uniref:Uncharacterized protein n=1 Tax=Candidatus Anoxymicrobium japonicum TaxID=2013648 RepID=A0A2N3G6B2_9ACTN|nr:MAG: hypothetical protein CVT63_03645 [Candidatus Anoxymicrobium japonicum]